MRILTFLLLICFMSSCLNSKTGSGNIITSTRDEGSFSQIKASGAVKVDIRNGPNAIVVEADDNLMKYIETKVSGEVLTIRLRNINSLRNATIKIHVTAPQLTRINASAGAEVKSDNVIVSDDKMDLQASSGAELSLKADAPEVSISASSGGNVNVSGRTKNVTAHASSGSSVKASGLLSENADAHSSSGGSVNVNASISIKASASSAGQVRYTGGATVMKKEESSGGTVSGN